MNKTKIAISQTDLDRVARLLENDSNRALPGIEMLREELNRADILEPAKIDPDVVTMNSTVRFIDDTTSTTSELRLVYPDQAGKPGTVSVLAPVGSALLGLRTGQSIRWQIPGGRQLQLRVVSVISQPEKGLHSEAQNAQSGANA